MRKLSLILTAIALTTCSISNAWDAGETAFFMQVCTNGRDVDDCAEDAERAQELGCTANEMVLFLQSVPGAQPVRIPECLTTTTGP
jgi:citrate lyase beta subunit